MRLIHGLTNSLANRLILGLLLCITLSRPGIAQIDTCGVLVPHIIFCFVPPCPQCPPLFETDSGERFSLDNLGSFQVGDRVQVTGALSSCSFSLCARNNCIANNTISECVDPPNAFSLTTPANNAPFCHYGVFDWEATTDPNGGPITYKLIIANDIGFSTNSIIYEQDGLIISHAAIDKDVKLIPEGAEDGDLFYWKVEATNDRGAVTSSNIHVFELNPNITSGGIITSVAFSARGDTFMQAVRSDAYQGNANAIADGEGVDGYSTNPDKIVPPPHPAPPNVTATATMLQTKVNGPIEVIACLSDDQAPQGGSSNSRGKCGNNEAQIASMQIQLEEGMEKTVFFDLDLIMRDGFEN